MMVVTWIRWPDPEFSWPNIVPFAGPVDPRVCVHRTTNMGIATRCDLNRSVFARNPSLACPPGRGAQPTERARHGPAQHNHHRRSRHTLGNSPRRSHRYPRPTARRRRIPSHRSRLRIVADLDAQPRQAYSGRRRRNRRLRGGIGSTSAQPTARGPRSAAARPASTPPARQERPDRRRGSRTNSVGGQGKRRTQARRWTN